MIGPLGRLGAVATLGQHCPQMTQRRCMSPPARMMPWLHKGRGNERGRRLRTWRLLRRDSLLFLLPLAPYQLRTCLSGIVGKGEGGEKSRRQKSLATAECSGQPSEQASLRGDVQMTSAIFQDFRPLPPLVSTKSAQRPFLWSDFSQPPPSPF